MPRRVLEGKVVSNKNAKTVTVLVEHRVRDPLYGKIMRRSAKYAAHVEGDMWQIGDKVSIEECRPLSKSKRWRVIKGKAMGESQAKTVDESDEKHTSVKRKLTEEEAALEAKEEAKAKPAKKAKKED